MEREFKLEIITPTRSMDPISAVSVTATATDGEICALAGHTPMAAALGIGSLTVRTKDETKYAFHSEGFMEVRPDEVLIFVQACEWADEIDAARAEEALQRAEERLRQKQSLYEHHHTEISLSRAMTRLRVTGHKNSKWNH